MNPLSIFMFLFSAALFIYAALMAITKDYTILPVRARVAVKPKDSKEYTFQLSKVIALVAVAPALGGVVALWNEVAGMLVILFGVIAAIWVGTKIMKKVS